MEGKVVANCVCQLDHYCSLSVCRDQLRIWKDNLWSFSKNLILRMIANYFAIPDK